MIATTERAARNGTISFDGSAVVYRTTTDESVSTPISEIAVIGEFTTPEGPWADDWFLVFVLRGSGEWIRFPMYVEGIETLSDRLSGHLGSRVHACLANRTDFMSRIMWPPRLIGRPLFTLTSVREGNFLRRLISSIAQEIGYRLSPEALSAAKLED